MIMMNVSTLTADLSMTTEEGSGVGKAIDAISGIDDVIY
jgi:hypothetical protein